MAKGKAPSPPKPSAAQKAQMAKDNLILFVEILVMISIIVSIVLAFLAAIGVTGMNNCLTRYASGSNNNTYLTFEQVKLNANGNYSYSMDTTSTNPTMTVNPASYGRWVSTFAVQQNEVVSLNISGSVSLCNAYLPPFNLESNSNTATTSTHPIIIPRVESNQFLQLKFAATSQSLWRNIAKLNTGDLVKINVSPNVNPNNTANITSLTYTSSITGNTESNLSCAAGGVSYHPVCGRYAAAAPVFYVSACTPTAYGCDSGTFSENCHSCSWTGASTWSRMTSQYQDDGSQTYPYSANMSNLLPHSNTTISSTHTPYCAGSDVVNGSCVTSADTICQNGLYTSNTQASTRSITYARCGYVDVDNCNCTKNTYNAPTSIPGLKFWYTADQATALIYKLGTVDSTGAPSNASTLGTPTDPLASTSSTSDAGPYFAPVPDRHGIIYNNKYVDDSTQYLQYAFLPAVSGSGGYIISVAQTACRRENGQYVANANDGYNNRGQIKYVILNSSSDPNANPSLAQNSSSLLPDAHGNVNFTSSNAGTMWLLIDNNPNDYQNSTGTYLVSKSTTHTSSSFGVEILGPLLDTFKNTIVNQGTNAFQRMTCSNLTDQSSCANFFNYIRAMLTLYVTLFGLMFLLGMVEITTQDLVIRIVKIGIVAGLMNGSTFGLFQEYVFNFVTGFSDRLIYNMSGYNNFFVSQGTTATNPLMFLDGIMTRIFFNPVFVAQLLSTLGFGIYGIFLFVIIIVALLVFIVSVFRATAVYIMATIAVAVLLGVAPLFLTFFLFEKTYYLFENWTRLLCRYMIEPAILMIGMIIITQLFTMYLDTILGYSVCWKCALSIRIPFVVPVLSSIFQNVSIFCIQWFSPWGYDANTDTMDLGIDDVVALMMLAFCLWSYIRVAGQLTGRLTNTPMAPSATSAGSAMVSAVGQAALSRAGLDSRNRDRQWNSFKQSMNERQKNTSKLNAQRRKPGDIKGSAGGAKSHSNSPKQSNTSAQNTATPDSTPTAPRSASDTGTSTAGTSTASATDKGDTYKKLKEQQDASETVGTGGIKESLKNITKKIRE